MTREAFRVFHVLAAENNEHESTRAKRYIRLCAALLPIYGCVCLVFTNYRYEISNDILALYIINDSYDVTQTINLSVSTKYAYYHDNLN
jgi:hypothetical protein